jgi:hypothetical protein
MSEQAFRDRLAEALGRELALRQEIERLRIELRAAQTGVGALQGLYEPVTAEELAEAAVDVRENTMPNKSDVEWAQHIVAYLGPLYRQRKP